MYTELKYMFYLILTFLGAYFWPQDVYAWGPGAHMDYALYALSHLASLAPVVQGLLSQYRQDYLYGNIAADIILGKKFAGELYHCHNWEVALPILDKAKTDAQRAFMYGYLSHLSVDIISHNFFVPFKMIRSWETLTLRHTYWEMRYDTHMNPKAWDVLESLAQDKFIEHDELLAASLKRALFSFGTTKKIFDSIMMLSRMHKWRRAAEILGKNSQYLLEDNDVKEYKKLCYESILNFLRNPTAARCFNADPSGKLKLLYAKETIKELRAARRKRMISAEQCKEFINLVKQKLKEGIYKPVELPGLSGFLG